MTDMTSSSVIQPQVSTGVDLLRTGFRIEESHWGYAIVNTDPSVQKLGFSQTLSLLVGAGLLAAAIGMWLLPSMMFGADAIFMRLFSSIVFVSLSAFFLWYSSRGLHSEIHIDTSRGEVREVVRNHAGRMTLIGCYGFDCVRGSSIETDEETGGLLLALRFRHSEQSLIVAAGEHADLSDLKSRIGHDVIIRAEEAA